MIFDEFIFKLLAFFIGNLSAMIYLALVASNNGTPNNNTTTNDNEIGQTETRRGVPRARD